MTSLAKKFLFKTFNKNASSLSVDPAMKTVLRDIMETLDLHGSLIEKLSEEEPESLGLVFVPSPVEQKDNVQLLLHQEVFGGVV